MQCFISPLNALYLQYTLPTYATLTCAHKCNQLFLILHKIHSQVSTNTTCTKLRERPHITSSDRSERGFVARFTFSCYTTWRSKLHKFRQNYTTMKTYLWTTWNSYWFATVRALCHWHFHLPSFRLALPLLCDVSYVTVNENFSW